MSATPLRTHLTLKKMSFETIIALNCTYETTVEIGYTDILNFSWLFLEQREAESRTKTGNKDYFDFLYMTRVGLI